MAPQQEDFTKDPQNYRGAVGPAEIYDVQGATQFNLLTLLGLREHHFLLDIGCGSLRSGKLFIPYLLQGNYYGIEPNEVLIKQGIKQELCQELIDLKKPSFSNDSNFTLTTFNESFDFILAQSIFSHASQAQIKRCFSEAKKVMKKNCIFAATFVKGEENYTGDEWVYPGVTTYTLERMKELAESEGLTCQPIDWPHPNLQSWMLILQPDREESIPELTNTSKLLTLERELKVCRARVAKMEKNPYIQLAMKISRKVEQFKGRLSPK